MAYYHRNIKDAIIPKMHLLEEHVVPWLGQWGIGMGLMAEHGAESIHARINSLKLYYTNQSAISSEDIHTMSKLHRCVVIYARINSLKLYYTNMPNAVTADNQSSPSPDLSM